ncbi:MAG: DUF502 domain-containing protein [Spongiibacteraceae bacterium]
MNKLWQWVTSQTLRGLLLLVPLVITISFLVWLGRTIETSLKPIFEWLLPPGWYFPGFALLLFLLTAFVLGLMTRNVLLQKTLEITERWMTKLPVIGSVYPVVRQVTDLLSGKSNNQNGSVVLATIPDTDTQVIGIVTRPTDGQSPHWLQDDCEMVFVPMSYQVGGFTLILPRSQLQPLNMKPGEALQMVLMGGIVQPKSPRSGD